MPDTRPGALNLLEYIAKIEVPEIEAPILNVMEPAKADKDIFAVKRHAAWKEGEAPEARCDFSPNCLRITRRAGLMFISLWKKSVYGRTLSDIKSDPEMVDYFARNMAELIGAVLGPSLSAAHYAIVTTPKRRHHENHFATKICEQLAALLGLPFYEDCAIAHSRHRVGAVFTPGNIPPQQNIIVFDDFVTTGQTLAAMQSLLAPLGKNCIFFAAINNKC